MAVSHNPNRAALQAILLSPQGGVAKDLLRRGRKVANKAKRNLNEDFPRRVDTGLLRSSVQAELVSLGGKVAVRVGTNVEYARFVHDGTGIYGPMGTPILPKNGKYLAWRNKAGKMVYAKKVLGMKPNPFLKNAMMAAKD